MEVEYNDFKTTMETFFGWIKAIKEEINKFI